MSMMNKYKSSRTNVFLMARPRTVDLAGTRDHIGLTGRLIHNVSKGETRYRETVMNYDDNQVRFYGLYQAIVVDIIDPMERGRILVQLVGNAERSGPTWATLLTPYADRDQGIEVLPEISSLVIVAFEAGDPAFPYIVGAFWNDVRTPPVTPKLTNDLRTWKTRAGSQLEFDDNRNGAKITLSIKSGHCVVLDEAEQQVEIRHGNGCTIVLNAVGEVSITANSAVELTASAFNVHAPLVKCDGAVQCENLVANSVSSKFYTPGIGNIW
jgi:uncharacterized protein involved in type VI secretion and phage assembly